MQRLDDFIYKYAIDPTWYYGEGATMMEHFKIQVVTLFVLGVVWFVFFTAFYWAAEKLAYTVWPHYRKMRPIERTDWTSRIVATFMICCSIFFSLKIKFLGEESFLEPEGGVNGRYEETQYLLHKFGNNEILYWLYHSYSMLLGYEIYDLKNCINLKMTSGVIHHAVLIVMFPIGWGATTLSVPSLYMTTFSYCSNLPAHLRSFLLHTGFRETELYRINKWAWWVSYIVFRLFGIPWFSSGIYFVVPAALGQTPFFTVVWFFSSMVVHYMLSLYWFVNMSKTMFPPKDYDLKRVESFGTLPKDDTPKAPRRNDGGQKFD